MMEVTWDEMKKMKVGSKIHKGCPNCESLELHIKQADGSWLCQYCKGEEFTLVDKYKELKG